MLNVEIIFGFNNTFISKFHIDVDIVDLNGIGIEWLR